MSIKLFFLILLISSCASTRTNVSTDVERTKSLQPLQKARYFQSQPNIRIYLYDDKDNRFIYPLFEKKILTPQSFSDRFEPTYKMNRNDSNFTKTMDFDFKGKIIVVWDVEFVETEDFTKVNITVSEGLQDFKVYCFSFKTDESKVIEEQLEQMQELEQPIKVCYGYL
jgi:hypothetical protein